MLAACASLPALAQDSGVVSTFVRGTVIYLAGDRWEEVTRGQDLSQAAIRTLRSGRLSIETPAGTLEIGPSAALELSSTGPGQLAIKQHAGALKLSAGGATAHSIALQAGQLAITEVTGDAEIVVSKSSTVLTVRSGHVSIRTANGRAASVGAGSYETNDGSGGIGVALTAPAAPQGSGGDNNAGGNGNSNAGGNGNGNAGGNGSNNAGGNGNANGNGNAGGNGNSNAGGNGNNNAGNSGNANAGGNESGNAGSSGSENAGENGSSNAGGNANGNAGGNASVDASNAGGKGKGNGNSSGNSNGTGGGNGGSNSAPVPAEADAQAGGGEPESSTGVAVE